MPAAPVLSASASASKSQAAFVPLKLGGDVVHLKLPGSSAEIAAARHSAMQVPAAETPQWESPDLGLIAQRCELKALACGIAIDRRAAAGTPQEDEHRQRAVAAIARGKQLKNCFLWQVYLGKPLPPDPVLRVIGQAYSNLSLAARLAERVPAGGLHERRRRALSLLAEAQSALRVALLDTWLDRPDQDQDDAFYFLDDATTYENVFVERYMRLQDPADPAHGPDLERRIREFAAELDAIDARTKKSDTLISRIRHHCRQIAGKAGQDSAYDWDKIEQTLRELKSAGHDLAAQRVVEPIRAIRSFEPSEGFPLTRSILAAPESATMAQPADGYSPSVATVRAVLRNARVVLVGGERREEAARRIREAFGLSDLEWLAPAEHSSAAPLEAPIRRADTRLVLVLIRLAGHLQVDAVEQFCKDYGKPLVRLPAGYNPEQIAAQVLEQASVQLGIDGTVA